MVLFVSLPNNLIISQAFKLMFATCVITICLYIQNIILSMYYIFDIHDI